MVNKSFMSLSFVKKKKIKKKEGKKYVDYVKSDVYWDTELSLDKINLIPVW